MRKHTNFCCDACGRELVTMAIVPTDIWLKIRGSDYALCEVCMDDRLANAGIRCEPYIHFFGERGALVTPAPGWAQAIMSQFMPTRFPGINVLS